jgi:hypothetical protein
MRSPGQGIDWSVGSTTLLPRATGRRSFVAIRRRPTAGRRARRAGRRGRAPRGWPRGRRQELERAPSLEGEVPGQVEHSHPALAQPLVDVVVADAPADHVPRGTSCRRRRLAVSRVTWPRCHDGRSVAMPPEPSSRSSRCRSAGAALRACDSTRNRRRPGCYAYSTGQEEPHRKCETEWPRAASRRGASACGTRVEPIARKRTCRTARPRTRWPS